MEPGDCCDCLEALGSNAEYCPRCQGYMSGLAAGRAEVPQMMEALRLALDDCQRNYGVACGQAYNAEAALAALQKRIDEAERLTIHPDLGMSGLAEITIGTFALVPVEDPQQ